MNRRRFFRAGIAPVFIPRLFAANRDPNFLFLLADDHAAYVLGADGNSHAKTPNLDRLAAEGVRFRRAYCNSPMCTPSRQSLLTGQMPHAAGVTRLATPLSPDKAVCSENLRKAELQTAVFGKMHLHDRNPKNGSFGFDLYMTEDRIAQQWRRDVKAAPIQDWIRTQNLPWRPLRSPAREWLNSECLPYPRRDEDMLGTYIARQAAKYLEENADKRFALWVSLMEPHSPFDFPIEDRGRFDPRKFTVPRTGPEDAWQIPTIFKDLTEQERQGITAAYYTSTSFMDRNIGRVLDKLKQLRLDENTLVIYAGDNGYLLGHHGRFEKHCGYDEAIRVPLIARWPKRIRPRVVNELIEMIDVAPTVLDMMGAPHLPAQQGQSLRPYLEHGHDPSARKAVVSEYTENEEVYVRTDRWKLIHGSGKRARQEGYVTDNPTPGRTVQLFDLKADPGEFSNVARANPRVVAELQQIALDRYRRTHPEVGQEPAGASREDALEFYVRPRD